jgi:hypothetical protein
LSTPSDASLSPEELERLREIVKDTNRPFYYELQRPAAKRPEQEEEEDDEEDGKKQEENEEEDEQQEPWRLTYAESLCLAELLLVALVGFGREYVVSGDGPAAHPRRMKML